MEQFLSAKFLSGRNANVKAGIVGVTTDQKVLEAVGRVGIGSTIFDPVSNLEVRGNSVFTGSTSEELVRITQTGTGPAFLVEDSENPDTTPFAVTTDGRVVIGVGPAGISTIYKLEVDGGGNGGSVRFVSGGQGDLIFSHSNLVSNIRAAGNIQLGLGANGGDAIRINLNNNVGLGTTVATSKLYVVGDGYFTGIVTSSGFYVGGELIGAGTSLAQLYVSGITTLAATSGIVTTGGDFYVGGDLYVADDFRFDELNGRNINLTGIATLPTLNVTSGIITNLTGVAATITTLNGTDVNITTGNITTANIVTGVVTTLGGTNLNYTGVGTIARIVSTAASFSQLQVTGVSTFNGAITGTISTATKLETARTFEIIGDVVASPITFDGTGNISLAATIQPNSVGLGTDTFGDYVRNISGTANEINVTGGTGEGSTPVISFAPNPTIGGNVTIGNDLQVNNNLNVTGNITVGGTEGYILVESFRVSDADIVLGFTTDSQGNDVSTDTTANHGGIAIASTEGNPLVNLNIVGIETLPPTYKKFMWFKAGSFAGLNTDAWLSNYAIGIGSTQFPSGTRLAAGSVQFTENDLAVVRNINASGIITGTLANNLTLNTSGTGLSGLATYNNSGATTFTVTSNATSNNIPSTIVARDASGNFSAETITANLTGNATSATYADSSGIATYASTSGVSTDVIGGIASVSQLNVSGITTTNNLNVTGVGTFLSSGLKIRNPADTFQYNITGGAITANRTLNLPVITATDTLAALNISQTFTNTQTFNGTLSAAALLSLSGNTSGTHLFGTNQTSGTLTFGGTSGTGLITFGRATTSQTTDIQAGATASGNIKTIRIGTGGLSGSNTQIDIGPTAGVGTVAINSGTNLGIGSATPTSKLDVDGNGKFTGVVTATTFSGNATSATFATTAGVSTNVIGGIGSITQLSVSGVSTLGVVTAGNIFSTGIVTAPTFVGNLTGTASTASFATTAFSLNGTVEGNLNVAFARVAGIATFATNAGIATNLRGGVAGNVPYQSAPDTTTFVSNGLSGQVLLFNGSIPIWGNVSAASGAFGGIAVYDEGNLVGTAGSIAALNFVSPNLVVTGTSGANGIATVRMSDNLVGTALSISGISTFSNNVLVGSGITMYASTGIVSATAFYGSGLNLSDLILGKIEGLQIQNEGSNVGTGFTYATLNFIGDYVTATGVGTVANITFTTPPYALVAGVSTSVIGGIASVTSLNVSGVSTIGNFRIIPVGSGATVGGIGVTYFGDGSQLTGINASGGVSISTNTTNQNQLITYAISTGSTTGFGVTASGLVFNPSTTRLGIGTTNPLQNLHIQGNLLVAAGSATTQHITQRAYELEGGSLSWEGTAGQLFSITNNLTSGPIFSVNDVSGIPSIEVTADGTIELAPFADGNVGIATTRPTSRLHVIGDALVVGVVTATTFSGNATSATFATIAGVSTNVRGTANRVLYNSGTDTTTTSANLTFDGTILGVSETANIKRITAAHSTGSIIAGDTTTGVTITGANNVNNVFIGVGVGQTNTGGDSGYNNVIGYQAGGRIVTGAGGDPGYNNIMGYQAGQDVSTGSSTDTGYNNILGYQAGKSVSSAAYNNVLGYQAGQSLDGAPYNNLFGYRVGNSLYTGAGGAAGYNNVIGYESLLRLSVGNSQDAGYNNFIGYQNAYVTQLTGGSGYNNGIGFRALYQTNGRGNNAFGWNALYGATSGDYNIGIGFTAGGNITSGSRNIAIGYNAQVPSATGSDQLAIGSNDSYWIVGNSSYNVGIGTINPTSRLHVVGDVLVSGASTLGTVRISSGIITATSGVVTYFGDGSQLSGISAGLSITDDTSTNATRYILFDDVTSGTITGANVSSTKLTFNPSTGNLVAGGTVTANSDERLKENVKTIENALDKVLSLRGVEFDRIDTGDHQIGVIAQEVEKIIPDVVYPKQPSPDYETKSVAYANLVGLLIEAVKEQNRRIDELERRLEGN